MRAVAGDWPWSSYRAAVGSTAAPRFLTLDWLLAQFGQDDAGARANYASFVAAGPIRASP